MIIYVHTIGTKTVQKQVKRVHHYFFLHLSLSYFLNSFEVANSKEQHKPAALAWSFIVKLQTFTLIKIPFFNSTFKPRHSKILDFENFVTDFTLVS